jgi:ABC-type Fe2+-enterobactin transport system substrate-binding protein
MAVTQSLTLPQPKVVVVVVVEHLELHLIQAAQVAAVPDIQAQLLELLDFKAKDLPEVQAVRARHHTVEVEVEVLVK